jgi:hypothetical protein
MGIKNFFSKFSRPQKRTIEEKEHAPINPRGQKAAMLIAYSIHLRLTDKEAGAYAKVKKSSARATELLADEYLFVVDRVRQDGRNVRRCSLTEKGLRETRGIIVALAHEPSTKNVGE